MIPAARSGIMPTVAKRVRAMGITVVEQKALLGMFATETNLAAAEKDRPCGVMCLQEELVVLVSPSQLKELI